MPQVVSNVVSALGPSIAAAVEQALAAQAAQQSRLQAEARARDGAEGSRLTASRTTTLEEPSDPPKYNFEYKVADEQDQTYIS